MAETETPDYTPRDLFTVEQFSDRHQAFTQPSIRNLILNSEDRLNSRGERIAGNGLSEAGAIVRVGRRVLIDDRRFFAWIAQQQRQCNEQRRDGSLANDRLVVENERLRERVAKLEQSP